MKVVILAGGFGTRISEYTDVIPKPMIRIGNEPIINHIMTIYSKHGFNDFIIALGYKSEVIKEYFLNFKNLNSDLEINLKDGTKNFLKTTEIDWNIKLVNTGKSSMTGGRILRLKRYIGNETFMLTYGDGVSDINIKKLIEFHKNNSKVATVTAVRPVARFGELQIKDKNVISFSEKPQTQKGWINGGFFVFEPEIFDYLENDNTVLEKEPLINLSSENKLAAYQHNGFWHCMDTKRDKLILDSLCNDKKPPWK
ncbi:MAG: glucose-1-phosphate cytidylyltransferase [Candidatus Marinimicrobia bacterium]|nr:glucose-1-phosphate cytidylyltransferase [Candidatus Neomarinimicrobiota bacterium]|tara:strand:- start:99 stop:860 length:762 start_codon:yes stop_codon:yes gene_type:complete